MAIGRDWLKDAVAEIVSSVAEGDLVSEAARVQDILERHCPFKPGVAYVEYREPPLLQCVNCNNTESCAGAMARAHWHPGRCMHCGGAFKVVRA